MKINAKIQQTSLELVTGNIVSQPDMDAIVNAANAQLRIGGGVAGAIHSIGDPELERETRPLAPIQPGDAVITSAPNLPNKYIIHCLGPVYGRDKPADKLLADCYRNALKLTAENEIKSIAFPAISTGAFGYPIQEAASIAIKVISAEIRNLDHLETVRMVLWSQHAFDIHATEFDQIES